jgi:hypothetical protein
MVRISGNAPPRPCPSPGVLESQSAWPSRDRRNGRSGSGTQEGTKTGSLNEARSAFARSRRKRLGRNALLNPKRGGTRLASDLRNTLEEHRPNHRLLALATTRRGGSLGAMDVVEIPWPEQRFVGVNALSAIDGVQEVEMKAD